ncbi:MAG: hemerythrin domain-containing protein [Alphaproteobacteria bacterium]|nr:hemerythrin domain-containing protein [Alphaproteobacteria bacterium]
MSIIDKVIAAVTPPESDEARAKARAEATAACEPGDWLSLVLDHHIELEDAVAAVEDATTADERTDAFKEFAVLLTGHAIAEEGVLYPGLSANSETGHADMGYTEQAMVKMQMAALEKLDPMSQEFEDKLEHVKGALMHHMYEEEGNWFLDLKKKATPEEQEMMTARYTEEFERYTGESMVEDDEDEELED